VSGRYPDIDSITHHESHKKAHADDGCPLFENSDQVFDADNGSREGQLFSFSGTFDPDHPPSSLNGVVNEEEGGSGEGGEAPPKAHLEMKMHLDYGSPVLGPPDPPEGP
jgi:hypothetical protein